MPYNYGAYFKNISKRNTQTGKLLKLFPIGNAPIWSVENKNKKIVIYKEVSLKLNKSIYKYNTYILYVRKTHSQYL